MAIRNPDERINLLPVGQRICLIPQLRGGLDTPGEGYPSRIEDVFDDGVVVSMPMHRCCLIALPLHSRVRCLFNRGGLRFGFEGTVGGQEIVPFPVLYLKELGAFAREERRAHTRVPTLIVPSSLSVVEGDSEVRPGPQSLLIVNLSAGGLGLVSSTLLTVGMVLRIGWELPKGFGGMQAEAEVVRCSRLEAGGLSKWQAGVAFRELKPKEADRISAFVLAQQGSLRKRGLL